ncbi:Clp protease [Hoyosella rhizosphaerae]|uniref:Clp protease n=1 Tax=Hoyosella rhizosphaerae TaxID=1755582 RepID=A0A916TYW3_9ACTN|nr:Clp protease N-terminal domain-containing protein [Hoyosella rhizosphaerae]MBN4927218.1 Clp protease [Hoyosella rhizosphaerae]GGC53067.1 Clp protease [Hoyosella rhizosphaerae]
MFERFSRSARAGVVLSQEEARDAGADRITPTHLILGVLGSLDADTSTALSALGVSADSIRENAKDTVFTTGETEALREVGIDLNTIADTINKRFGFDIRRPIRKRFRTGHIPFSTGAKKSLELALREAIARKDRTIGAEHVLLGIIRSDDAEVLAAIEAIVPRSQLRQRLHEMLDEPAA